MGSSHKSQSRNFRNEELLQIIEESEGLLELRTQLCLEVGQIYEIYAYFSRLDRSYKGYIELDDLIEELSQHDENFVELPYLEYLFTLIHKSKSEENILFFEEFLQGILVFCLMNGESILEFIFDCIDSDNDDRISKEDIRRFLLYTNPKNGRHTFFTNFAKEVDKVKLKEDQTVLDFEQFRSNSDHLHFLIWPAYQLQETFRNQILGAQAWLDLYSKAEKREYEIKNNEKKELRLKEKLQALQSIKPQLEGPFFKDSVKFRKCGESNTDEKLGAHLERPRRNSSPYIKPEFKLYISHVQVNASQKYK